MFFSYPPAPSAIPHRGWRGFQPQLRPLPGGTEQLEEWRVRRDHPPGFPTGRGSGVERPVVHETDQCCTAHPQDSREDEHLPENRPRSRHQLERQPQVRAGSGVVREGGAWQACLRARIPRPTHERSENGEKFEAYEQS